MWARLTALAAAALAIATPAQADWKEATSKNFIVYSEGSEKRLREFAAKLEKFDYVLRAYHRVTAPPSPVKLRVYLLPSIGAVGKMAGGGGVAGYYVRDARGLMMVGTHSSSRDLADIRSSRDLVDIDYESILLHEYTHHFMYQYFPATYPSWYSEGFAEFWGGTRFLPGDVVEVGLPASYRFGSFWANRWLPVSKLLTAHSYADVPDLDLLYAEGWLLVRYAFDNPKRQRQLQAYLTAINAGTSYEDAMKQAFGDPADLNSELFDYAGRSKFSVLQLPFKPIDVGTIAIREVSPAEDALMAYEIQLRQGILKSEIADFAKKLRGEASRFPDDPHALDLVADAERLAGNTDAARAAVDRLLKVAPNHPRGLMRKAQLEAEALKAAGSTDAKAWQAARQPILQANKLAPNDPLILEAYYDSFVAQGVLPPDSAQNALFQAMELAPSDSELRYKVASDFERRDMIEEAIAVIRPAAYVLPHRKNETASERKEREKREEKYREAGREKRETAREMLERLQRKLAAKTGGKAGG